MQKIFRFVLALSFSVATFSCFGMQRGGYTMDNVGGQLKALGLEKLIENKLDGLVRYLNHDDVSLRELPSQYDTLIIALTADDVDSGYGAYDDKIDQLNAEISTLKKMLKENDSLVQELSSIFEKFVQDTGVDAEGEIDGDEAFSAALDDAIASDSSPSERFAAVIKKIIGQGDRLKARIEELEKLRFKSMVFMREKFRAVAVKHQLEE